MSSDPEKPRAWCATLRVERAKRADRLHERLGREIRDVLRITTAPREKRRHASHVRAVQSLKLSDGLLRGTLTRPQKRTRRARNTHMQYLVKPLARPIPSRGVAGTMGRFRLAVLQVVEMPELPNPDRLAATRAHHMAARHDRLPTLPIKTMRRRIPLRLNHPLRDLRMLARAIRLPRMRRAEHLAAELARPHATRLA